MLGNSFRVLTMFLLIVSLQFTPFNTARGQDSGNTSASMRDFNYDTATDFSQLGGYVSSQINGVLQNQLAPRIEQWTRAYQTEWTEANSFANSAMQAAENYPANVEAYREGLKAELKRQLQSAYPETIGNYLRNELLGNSGSAEVEAMVAAVTDRAMQGLDTIVNAAVSATNSRPELVAFGMVQNMTQSVGESTKEGMKDYLDKTMQETLELGAAEDIKGAIDDTFAKADEALRSLDGVLGQGIDTLEDFKETYSVENLKQKIDQVLAESGLPNPLNLSAEDYIVTQMNGAMQSGINSLNAAASVSLPTVEMPSSAYAAVQIASGAGHFARAITPWGINPAEIEMGRKCVETAEWALTEKTRAFMIMGGDFGVGSALSGITNQVSDAVMQQVGSVLDQIDGLNLGALSELQAGIDNVMDQLGSIKGELDAQVSAVQAQLAGVQGAVNDVVDTIEAPVVAVRDEIDGAIDTMVDAGQNAAEQGIANVAEGLGLDPEASQDFLADVMGTNEAVNADASSAFDPVILYSGEFKNEVEDLRVKSVGIDFVFKRIYRSQRERDGVLGFNWTHNYNQRLIARDGEILFQDADGQAYAFRPDGRGGFVAPRQLYAELTKTSDGFEIAFGQGQVRRFDTKGYIKSIADRFGNEMRFEYVMVGKRRLLSKIIDTQGRAYTFAYAGERLVKLTDPFGRAMEYAYSALGDLESSTSPATERYPNGRVTRYSYSGGYLDPKLNHNLTMIMDPKGQVYLQNEYGEEGIAFDRLVAQRFGGDDAPLMTLAYEEVAGAAGMNDVASRTTVTDRLGVKRTYEHNAVGLRLAGEGFRYTYNDDGLLVEEQSPGGRITRLSYDDAGDRFKQANLISREVVGKDGTKKTFEYTYGPFNQKAGQMQVAGSAERGVRFEFNDQGDKTATITATGRVSYAYDERGRLVSERRGEKVKTYAYDGALVTAIAETAGEASRNVTISYNAYGYIDAVTDAEGFTTRYWTDALGRVLQKRDALGTTTRFAFDENDNLVSKSVTAADGTVLSRLEIAYDVYDNPVERKTWVQGDHWSVERYVYDAEERLVEVHMPTGVKKGYVYNEEGWLVSEQENGAALYTRDYNADGEIVSEKDALGERQWWVRDGLGRVKRYVGKNGAQVLLSFGPFGDVLDTKIYGKEGKDDTLLKRVSYLYDDAGRTVRERAWGDDGAKRETERVYQGEHLSQVRDAAGVIKQYAYDGFGRVMSVTDAVGNTVSLSYDNRNDVVAKKVAKGDHAKETLFAYDALGRKIEARNAEGTKAKWEYDAVGNVIAKIDAMGVRTEYAWDGLGRILSEAQGARTRTWEWGRRGLLAGFIDGDGQQTHFEYDEAGRLANKRMPGGMKESLVYDALGRVTKRRAGGVDYAYTYGPLGELLSRTGGGYEQRFQYDGLGRMIASFDNNDPENPNDDVKVERRFDAFGDLAAEAVGERTVKYEYDGRGNVKSVTAPSGMEAHFAYDAAGWVQEVGAGGEELARFDYALLGMKERETLGNGVQEESTYNDLMRLAGESVGLEDARTKLYDYSYTYDAMGRVAVAEDLRTKTWTAYEYNDLAQLTKVAEGGASLARLGKGGDAFAKIWEISKQKTAFNMTPEGDWTSVNQSGEVVIPPARLSGGSESAGSRSIRVAAGHRYEQFGDTTIAYDQRGNLVQEGDTTYKYDPWNRIKEVSPLLCKEGQGEVDPSACSIVYTYDATNRRVTKSAGALATTYVYDNWNVIEEYEGSTLAQQYVHNRGVDEPVALIHDGEKYFYHQNRLGNVVAITDSAGVVKERYDYGPYGNVTIFDSEGSKLTASAINNPITYTGQRYDADTGLYYYKNRYYSPKLGRFMSKDPLGMVDGPNLYAYVNNDPTNWVDPMGTTILPSVGNSDINISTGDETGSQDESVAKVNDPTSSGQSAGDCDYELRKIVEDNDLYKDFDRLNDEEKMLVLLNPIAAYEVREARIKAEFATRKRFPDVKVAWNNQADAYRHAYWNAEMTRRMGMSLAEKFATAHEAGENNNPQEKQMDLYNNMVGRELADNDAFREMSVDELLEYALSEDLLQSQP